MSDFGIFENQPAHLLSSVLERVPYNDLNSLALSSKFWHSIIKKHVESPRFKKDILQSKNTFYIGKLIATISESNDFEMIEQFLENRWENEKDYDALGDAIRGFCSNSGKKMFKNVEKLFGFTWNLVEHLDVLVKEVFEDFNVEEVVDELDVLIAGKRRMELRRQLHSLFWKEADHGYKGFVLTELLGKIGDLVGPLLTNYYNLLQIILNPTRIIDNEEFIRINFQCENEMIVSLNAELLKPFAEAFKALQLTCTTVTDIETYSNFFHLYLTRFFFTPQLIAIFALEPSLLMWFLHDFSYVAWYPYFVAYILLEMTMIMRDGKYGSLEDLKSAFIDLKNHVYNRYSGYGHLIELQNSIGYARMHYCTYGKGMHPRVFDNEYTICLDIFGLGERELLLPFWSLENLGEPKIITIRFGFEKRI